MSGDVLRMMAAMHVTLKVGVILTCMRVLFRSGKSSIQKVVFHKMSPNETLFLESTNKIVKDGIL